MAENLIHQNINLRQHELDEQISHEKHSCEKEILSESIVVGKTVNNETIEDKGEGNSVDADSEESFSDERENREYSSEESAYEGSSSEAMVDDSSDDEVSPSNKSTNISVVDKKTDKELEKIATSSTGAVINDDLKELEDIEKNQKHLGRYVESDHIAKGQQSVQQNVDIEVQKIHVNEKVQDNQMMQDGDKMQDEEMMLDSDNVKDKQMMLDSDNVKDKQMVRDSDKVKDEQKVRDSDKVKDGQMVQEKLNKEEVKVEGNDQNLAKEQLREVGKVGDVGIGVDAKKDVLEIVAKADIDRKNSKESESETAVSTQRDTVENGSQGITNCEKESCFGNKERVKPDEVQNVEYGNLELSVRAEVLNDTNVKVSDELNSIQKNSNHSDQTESSEDYEHPESDYESANEDEMSKEVEDFRDDGKGNLDSEKDKLEKSLEEKGIEDEKVDSLEEDDEGSIEEGDAEESIEEDDDEESIEEDDEEESIEEDEEDESIEEYEEEESIEKDEEGSIEEDEEEGSLKKVDTENGSELSAKRVADKGMKSDEYSDDAGDSGASDSYMSSTTEDADEIDGERQEGDGQEEPAKELDDDEDKKNPAYVPRVGAFYEHDLRSGGKSCRRKEDARGQLWNDNRDHDWIHDCYNEEEQAPKSEQEICDQYGYNIRKGDQLPMEGESARRPFGKKNFSRRGQSRGGRGSYPQISRSSYHPPQIDSKIEFPDISNSQNVRTAPHSTRGGYPIVKEHGADGKDFSSNKPRCAINKKLVKQGFHSASNNPTSTLLTTSKSAIVKQVDDANTSVDSQQEDMNAISSIEHGALKLKGPNSVAHAPATGKERNQTTPVPDCNVDEKLGRPPVRQQAVRETGRLGESKRYTTNRRNPASLVDPDLPASSPNCQNIETQQTKIVQSKGRQNYHDAPYNRYQTNRVESQEFHPRREYNFRENKYGRGRNNRGNVSRETLSYSRPPRLSRESNSSVTMENNKYKSSGVHDNPVGNMGKIELNPSSQPFMSNQEGDSSSMRPIESVRSVRKAEETTETRNKRYSSQRLRPNASSFTSSNSMKIVMPQQNNAPIPNPGDHQQLTTNIMNVPPPFQIPTGYSFMPPRSQQLISYPNMQQFPVSSTNIPADHRELLPPVMSMSQPHDILAPPPGLPLPPSHPQTQMHHAEMMPNIQPEMLSSMNISGQSDMMSPPPPHQVAGTTYFSPGTLQYPKPGTTYFHTSPQQRTGRPVVATSRNTAAIPIVDPQEKNILP